MRRSVLGAMLPACLASAFAVAGMTLPALACLLVAAAAAQTGGRGRVAEELPVASVLVVGASLTLGELATLLDWRYLADTAQSRFILCIAGVGLALQAMAHPKADDGAADLVRMSAPALWIPRLPAISMAAIGLASQLLPLARRAAWFIGGDHVRHLLFVVEEHVVGNLSYDVATYPRAWHTLIALLWSADTARLDSQGFLSLAGIMSTCVWFLYAMLTLATSSLAVEFSRRAHLNERLSASAGLGAGALILWPSFVGPQMVLGFETSILAALLLCVASRELLRGWGSGRSMLIIGVCVVVMAHTWQLLVPPLAAAFVAAALAYCTPHWSRRRMSTVALTVLLGSLVSAPGAIAVATRIGISHATEEGAVPAVPLGAIIISVSAATFVLIHYRRDTAMAVAGAMVILASASAFGVAAMLHISPKTYYPTKLLWSAIFLSLPIVCFAAVALCRSLATRFSSHSRLVAVGFLAPLLVVVPASLTSSVLAATGHWAMVSPGLVLDAVATPRSSSAQVVWLAGDRTNGVIARILLDFYRVARTQERTPQPALTVAEECALLQRAPQPVVLSDAESVIVRSRYSCVPELEVLAVRPRSLPDARAGG